MNKFVAVNTVKPLTPAEAEALGRPRDRVRCR